MASYTKTSPWGNTPFTKTGELDLLRIRPVPAEDDDILYSIQSQFTYRPDLLAYALYGSSKLWWVFAQRNMDILIDPVYDLVPGVEIYLPQEPDLKRILGI